MPWSVFLSLRFLKGLTWSFHRRPDNLQHAFAFERTVLTPYTFATILVPTVFSYYVMAVLVQLPRTSLYRTALLPVVFWTTFRANMSLDLSWNYPGHAYLNQGLAVSVKVSPGLYRLELCNPARHVYRRNARHGMGVGTAALHQAAHLQVGKCHNPWSKWKFPHRARRLRLLRDVECLGSHYKSKGNWLGWASKDAHPDAVFPSGIPIDIFLAFSLSTHLLGTRIRHREQNRPLVWTRHLRDTKWRYNLRFLATSTRTIYEIIYCHGAFRDRCIRCHWGSLPATCGVVHDTISAIPITVAPSFRLPFFFDLAR